MFLKPSMTGVLYFLPHVFTGLFKKNKPTPGPTNTPPQATASQLFLLTMEAEEQVSTKASSDHR